MQNSTVSKIGIILVSMCAFVLVFNAVNLRQHYYNDKFYEYQQYQPVVINLPF